MGISDILKLEQENTHIILHKEGLFIKVYERSAYLFTKHLKAYNLTKKFYKNVNQEVVYVGFLQSSFSKIEGICKENNLTVREENNQLNITGLKSFTKSNFLDWKNNIAFIESESVTQSPHSHSLKENTIIEKIRNFTINLSSI